jgi:hypothetical protein
MENTEENSEKIGKIWKKIVKWYEKYGRKASQIVIWYGQYGRKASWIVKKYGKYRRKQWKDMEIMKKRLVE